MTKQQRKQLEAEVAALRKQLTGDMMKDMELRDKIHNIEMKLNGTKPDNTPFDCVGCGS